MPPVGDQRVSVRPRSLVPLKQSKGQGHPSPACKDLLIPLESNLEDSPVTPEGGMGHLSSDYNESLTTLISEEQSP